MGVTAPAPRTELAVPAQGGTLYGTILRLRTIVYSSVRGVYLRPLRVPQLLT